MEIIIPRIILLGEMELIDHNKPAHTTRLAQWWGLVFIWKDDLEIKNHYISNFP